MTYDDALSEEILCELIVIHRLFLFIGVAAFSEIHTWHRYKDLFYHPNFIVMVRPNHKRRSGLTMFPTGVRKHMKRLDDVTYEHGSGRKVRLQFVTQLDISATRIRASVSEQKSIRYLVPSTVEKYIIQRKLYQ